MLHVGGASPDRSTALSNAHRLLDGMPDDARRRLAIQHDDKIWSAREVLPLAVEHGLPLLADTLHNAVLPSNPSLSTAELLHHAARTWHALGLRPKHHVATQRRGGRPGAHSRRIGGRYMLSVLTSMNDEADFMLEAKDKDLALLQLRASLRLQGIAETSLRSMRVGGPSDSKCRGSSSVQADTLI